MGKYPAKRRKKIPHQQYRALDKVLEEGFCIEVYTMLYDNGWWACIESENGKLTFRGQSYDKLCKAKAFLGYQGERVIGYYRCVYFSNKAPTLTNFSCVKETFCAAVELNEAIKKHCGRRKRGWFEGGRPPLKPTEIGYYPGAIQPPPEGWTRSMEKKTPEPILRKPKYKAK